jgi:hypothetical protein
MKFRNIAMGNADEYRANAVHCFRMANKAFDPDDEQAWLNMAENDSGKTANAERNL